MFFEGKSTHTLPIMPTCLTSCFSLRAQKPLQVGTNAENGVVFQILPHTFTISINLADIDPNYPPGPKFVAGIRCHEIWYWSGWVNAWKVTYDFFRKDTMMVRIGFSHPTHGFWEHIEIPWAHFRPARTIITQLQLAYFKEHINGGRNVNLGHHVIVVPIEFLQDVKMGPGGSSSKPKKEEVWVMA